MVQEKNGWITLLFKLEGCQSLKGLLAYRGSSKKPNPACHLFLLPDPDLGFELEPHAPQCEA